MRLKQNLISIGPSIFFILGALACSHVQGNPITSPKNGIEEISRLELDQKDAYDRQLHIIAPTYYQKADSYLHQAKEGLKERVEAKEVLEKVAESRACLEKCEEVAVFADPILRDVLKARFDALEAQAAVFANAELKRADQEFVEVTLKLENEITQEAEENRESLRKSYAEVEFLAIKRNYLDPSRRLIDQAISEGAETKAPKILHQAHLSLTAFESLIKADPHNRAQIEENSKQFRRDSEQLLKITRQVRSQDNANAVSLELASTARKKRDRTVTQIRHAVKRTKTFMRPTNSVRGA